MKKNPQAKAPARPPLEFGFFLAGCILSFLLVIELASELFFSLHPSARIFLVLAVCLSFYIAAFLYANRTGQIKWLRRVQIVLFVIYLLCLADITLIGSSVGRLHFSGTRNDYLELFVNFRPLDTIKKYLIGFQNGYFSLWRFSLNLLGNLLLLAPLSLFLPILFRCERKWYFFLPTVLVASCIVEALQYLLMAGSCDIDDLILNFLGAAALFFLWKIPPLRRLIRVITKSEF